MLPSYVGTITNTTIIRIPIKQPVFHGKYLRVFSLRRFCFSEKNISGQKNMSPFFSEAYIMAIVMMLYKASVLVRFFVCEFFWLLCMTCLIYYNFNASNDFFFKIALYVHIYIYDIHYLDQRKKPTNHGMLCQSLPQKTHAKNQQDGMLRLFPYYRPAKRCIFS